MDRILIILKKEDGPRASSTPELGLNTILSNMFIGICSRSQVSVYRTIGPLVLCGTAFMFCSTVFMLCGTVFML